MGDKKKYISIDEDVKEGQFDEREEDLEEGSENGYPWAMSILMIGTKIDYPATGSIFDDRKEELVNTGSTAKWNVISRSIFDDREE